MIRRSDVNNQQMNRKNHQRLYIIRLIAMCYYYVFFILSIRSNKTLGTAIIYLAHKAAHRTPFFHKIRRVDVFVSYHPSIQCAHCLDRSIDRPIPPGWPP